MSNYLKFANRRGVIQPARRFRSTDPANLPTGPAIPKQHPRSRASLGAVVNVAQLQAPRPGEGLIQLQFCSIACLRKFLMAAVDELEKRADAVGPEVQAARQRAETEADAAADGGA